jgi:hypothetical protein
VSGRQQVVERQSAAHGLRAQLHQQAKLGEGCAHQSAGRGGGKFGDQGLKHGPVVAALEARREHQRAAADHAQRELEFGAAVGGIEVHQNQSGARCSEHGQDPLGAVRRPDADAFAWLEPAGEHSARDPFDFAIEFRVREAYRLERHHQRRTVRHLGGGGLEDAVDGKIEQRLIAGARHETQCLAAIHGRTSLILDHAPSHSRRSPAPTSAL